MNWLVQFHQYLAICLTHTGKLYLHENKLTGKIPPELGNMSKVSYLQLSDNELVGGIPAELGKLEQLFELCTGCGSGARGSAEMARIIRTIKRFAYDEGRKRRCGVSEIICGEEAE
uniref:Uncharacterized protein n=1 Tax=Nelumbo nucifera TaxID=4432 RepID=A0A822XJ10_NELNU|nr:TPA_asm: hypothetical protein HUJ06_021700 [Nelumbo nucifera]